MTGERGRAGFWASSLHFTWPSWYSPCYPSSFPLIVQHAASRGKVLVQAVSTAWVTKGPHISSLFIPNSGSVCKRFLPRLASHRLASPRHIAVRPLTAPASSTRTAPSTVLSILNRAIPSLAPESSLYDLSRDSRMWSSSPGRMSGWKHILAMHLRRGADWEDVCDEKGHRAA
jgi:hypothetical protein